MKRYLPLILGFVVATVWLGCDVTSENYVGEPNIYSFIYSDSSTVTVMVGRTISITDTIELDTVYDTVWYDDSTFHVWNQTRYPWNGVSEADVTLRNENESYTLIEDDSAGYYRLDSLGVLPNQTWTLEIKYPTGEKISAVSAIVGDFEISAPEQDTLGFFDTLRWNPAEKAGGYIVTSKQWGRWQWEDDPEAYDTTYASRFMGDTCQFTAVEFIFEFFVFDSMEFHVAALDSNAYDYLYYEVYKGFRDLKLDDYMHIEGAWGVFGSQLVKKTRRYVLD
ncbi:hypothetical protein JXM67_08080 [candidate division WOR-3 bacterium]|nr:hypothetical protein [candidate division WOR-3 bacterium]